MTLEQLRVKQSTIREPLQGGQPTGATENRREKKECKWHQSRSGKTGLSSVYRDVMSLQTVLRGTQFPCFTTSTKVQILTPKELRDRHWYSVYLLY